MNQKKVLIADDDQYFLAILKTKLHKEGFLVETCEDGHQAIAKSQEFSPDLIILDLIMPRMNGFDTLKKLKSLSNTKSIPVLVATNLGQEEDLSLVKELGAIGSFHKIDSSLDEVLTLIHSIL